MKKTWNLLSVNVILNANDRNELVNSEVRVIRDEQVFKNPAFVAYRNQLKQILTSLLKELSK